MCPKIQIVGDFVGCRPIDRPFCFHHGLFLGSVLMCNIRFRSRSLYLLVLKVMWLYVVSGSLLVAWKGLDTYSIKLSSILNIILISVRNLDSLQIILYVKEEMKKNNIPEPVVIGIVWSSVMSTVEWNKKEELVAEQAIKHLKVLELCLIKHYFCKWG